MVSPQDTHLGGLGGRRRAAHAYHARTRAGQKAVVRLRCMRVSSPHPPSGARIRIVADKGGEGIRKCHVTGVRPLLTFAERDAAAGGLPHGAGPKVGHLGRDKGAGESSQASGRGQVSEVDLSGAPTPSQHTVACRHRRGQPLLSQHTHSRLHLPYLAHERPEDEEPVALSVLTNQVEAHPVHRPRPASLDVRVPEDGGDVRRVGHIVRLACHREAWPHVSKVVPQVTFLLVQRGARAGDTHRPLR